MKKLLTTALLLSQLSLPLLAAAPAQNKPAPAISVQPLGGAPIALAKLKGKVVLLNFWATWCAPCRVEMPWFDEFSKTYKDRGLVVLGVAMDEDGWKKVTPVIKKLGVTYPIGINDGKNAAAYGVTDALPVTYLIDRSGTIRAIKTGFGSRADFEKEIKALL